MSRAACALFAAGLLLVIGCVFFQNPYGYAPGRLTLCTAGALAFFAGAHWIIRKTRPNFWWTSAFVLLVFGTVQMVHAHILRFTPSFDQDAVYGGAIQWLQTGSFPQYYEYYGYFPNNLGAMTLLRVWFGGSGWLFGGDYFLAASFLNCLLSQTTVFLTALCVKKLAGDRAAVTTLALFAASLPFWFIAPAFYTDALSMPFPVASYCLYLWARENEGRRKWALGGAACLIAAMGACIKMTVCIVLLAIFLEILLRGAWKRALIFLAAGLVCTMGVSAALTGHMYAHHLDRETAEYYKTPYLHWVMMGHWGMGGYNSTDYEFTRSFADKELQQQALLTEIGNRLRTLGPGGLWNLYTFKLAYDFGDGTYALSDFLDDGPHIERYAHRYVLYAGENYAQYRYVCTGVLMAAYLLAFAGAALSLRKGHAIRILAPRLALGGLAVFLCLWETSGRYFSNYVPFILLLAGLGLERIFVFFGRRRKEA